MWQLRHQSWAARFQLDKVAERSSPKRIPKARGGAKPVKGAKTKRGTTIPTTFTKGTRAQYDAVLLATKAKLARTAGRISIIDGKVDVASTLAILVGADAACEQAAGWLAAQLHLPVYRVSLDSLRGRQAGDIQRLFKRVFEAAARRDCVLYFDRAEAWFGPNTAGKVNDRVVDSLLEYIALSRGLVLWAVPSRKKIDPMWVQYADHCIDV